MKPKQLFFCGLTLLLCGCASDAGLHAPEQRESLAQFAKATRPLGTSIWLSLNQSSAIGVLLVYGRTTQGSIVLLDYQPADTPETALSKVGLVLPPTAVCIFRYRNAIPLPPLAQPCGVYSRSIALQKRVEDSERQNAEGFRTLGAASAAVRKAVEQATKTIRDDIDRH